MVVVRVSRRSTVYTRRVELKPQTSKQKENKRGKVSGDTLGEKEIRNRGNFPKDQVVLTMSHKVLP